MVKNESRADGATTHRLGYTIDRKHMGMLGFPGSDTYKTSLYPSEGVGERGGRALGNGGR